MSEIINYDKERVWQGILEKQERNKKRRWIFIVIGFLTIGAFVSTQLIFNSDKSLSSNENFSKESKEENIETRTESSDQKIYDNTGSLKSKTKEEKEKDQFSFHNTNLTKNNFENVLDSNQHNISNPIESAISINPKTKRQSLNTFKKEIKAASDFLDKAISSDIKTSINALNQENVSNKIVKQISILDNIQKINFIKSEVIFIAADEEIHTKIEVKNPAPTNRFQKAMFIESSLSFGSLNMRGVDELVVQREQLEHLNFVSSNTIGKEWQFQNRLLVRAGLNLDIISTTYEFTSEQIETNTIVADTAVIYVNGLTAPGELTFQEVISRRIVKNNELFLLGGQFLLGYEIASSDKWSAKAFVGPQLNYFQSFSGVVKDSNDQHLFSNEEINQIYYPNQLTAQVNAQLLVQRSLNHKLSVYAGMKFRSKQIDFGSESQFIQDHQTWGATLGLSKLF